MKQLREILWQDGGIVRNRQGLSRSIAEVEKIRAAAFGRTTGGNPRELQGVLGLRFACQTAALILEAAVRREESRGAHYREDFPDQNDKKWRGHLQVHRSSAGKLVWSFKAV